MPRGPRPGVKPHRMGCKMVKFLSVFWSKKPLVGLLWIWKYKICIIWPQKLVEGSSASIILIHPQFLLRKGFDLAGLISWLLSPQWDFNLFFFKIISCMWYTYSHIVTQIAKLYWKTIIFERYYSHNWRQRLQNVFLLENILDILLSKALKRKKTATRQWKC